MWIFHGVWFPYGPLTRYAKLRVAQAPGMPGTFPPPPRVSDPSMHHGTWVTHVPWCMPESVTSGFFCGWQFGRENVIDLPGACTTHNFTYLVRGLFHVSLQRCACANSPYIRVISCSYISICRQYPDMFLLCLASLLLNYQLLAHSRVEYTHILQGRLNSAWAVMCGKYDEIRQNKKDSAKIWNAKNAA